MFLQSFLMIFLAEMGDKSQFLMIAMASEYRLREIVSGTVAAILALNLLAVSVGSAVGGLLPESAVSLVAGGAFLAFVLLGGEEDASAGERSAGKSNRRRAFFSVFGTYFLAELGDKTQLTALTLAAGDADGAISRAGVFAGASAALIAADLLGLLAGTLLGKTLPTEVFRRLSLILFFSFGTLRILSGTEGLTGSRAVSVLTTAAAASVCAAVRILLFERKRRKERKYL